MPEIIRPPFEGALHGLWVAGDLTLPLQLKPPLDFDVDPLKAVAGMREWRSRTPIEDYYAAMGKVTGISVANPEAHKRRVALVGAPNGRGTLPPQLAIELARDEGERIIGCRITALLASPIGTEWRPEHLLAQVPVAVMQADAAGTLTAEFRAEAHLPEIRQLAEATGAVMLHAL